MSNHSRVSITKLVDNGPNKVQFSDLEIGDFFRMTSSKEGRIFIKISKRTDVPNCMHIGNTDCSHGDLSLECSHLACYPVDKVVVSVTDK